MPSATVPIVRGTVRRLRGIRGRWLLLVILAFLAAGAGVMAATAPPGRIGPDNRIQPSGRKLDPVGKLTRLGNLPTGGALTVDGRFAWTLSAGRGQNDVRIVRVLPRRCRSGSPRHVRHCRKRARKQVGKVVERIEMPGVSGGIAMAPDGRTAYVSGTPEGDKSSNEVGPSVPGQDGDVIHVFKLNRRSGKARRNGVIDVSPPPGTPPPQSFPPTQTGAQSWPQDLAVSADGKTLLVALNLANAAAIVDTSSRQVSYVTTGRYPYGAGITGDGKLGLVSNQTDGTVSVIDISSGDVIKEIAVGPHLSHPEGIAIDPKRPLAYVAVTHQDLIAVINTNSLEVVRTLSVERRKGIGTAPVELSVTRDGCRLLSADSGEDAVAVFALSGKRSCDPGARLRGGHRPAGDAQRRAAKQLLERESRRAVAVAGEEAKEEGLTDEPLQKAGKRWQLLGRIPVASYPTVALSTPQRDPARRKLVWITAKGIGVGPNQIPPDQPVSETGPAVANNDETPDSKGWRYYYLPEQVKGMSGIMRFPSDRRLDRLTPRAAKQIKPSNRMKPPADTPIRADGPIQHVFYIVRENRTYDQILGDEPRGDGDPKLTVFGKRITPNIHALVERFPLLDHVYANSEASIDGHFWTSAGAVSDYVVKNWHANYGGRQRPYDFGVYSVTWPAAGFLFDQAEKQGISWFNYGEAIAGTVPLDDVDRTPAENAQVAAKFAKSDLGPLAPGPQPPPPAPCFTNDAGTGVNVINGQEVFDSSRPSGANPANTESRFQCFRQRFSQQLADDAVPAFNYITYANDHTEGTTPGRRTPDAMVAANDLAVGETVDLISHSPIWDSSLILVVEDDSQDGADHVDAHRMPALAISPYTKRGAVVHTRYDFLSFIRTIELTIGMKPLNLFDATAVPLYRAFDSDPSDNDEPYDAIVPKVDLTATNPANAPNAELSDRLPLEVPDQVPQRTLDKILWQYRHGADSKPPPPGPNASGIDEANWPRGGISDSKAMEEVIENLGLDEDVIRERYGKRDG
jgi:YVTN family beta-propeller protein